MRHRTTGRHLNRDSGHRKALYRNLVAALFTQGYIKTTSAKAKAIKSLADQLITTAKQNTLPARRRLSQVISRPSLVNQLLHQVVPSTKDRYSGYTRLVNLPPRRGDNAPLARLELIDWQMTPAKPAPQKKQPPAKTSKKAPPPSMPKPATPLKQKLTTPKPLTTPASRASIQKRGEA